MLFLSTWRIIHQPIMDGMMKSLNECNSDTVATLVALATSLHHDVARLVTYDPSRDLKTLKARVGKEGISFLTITLSDFCADLMKSIESGQILSTYFRSFRKKGLIPLYLGGIIRALFAEDGRLLLDIDSAFIKHVRQLCLAYKKAKLPCTQRRIDDAIKRYKQDDEDLSVRISYDLEADFNHASRVLWTDLCDGISNRFINDDWNPAHGPGAVVERLDRNNKKYRFESWHQRLEPLFPILGTKLPLGSYDSMEFERVRLVAEDREEPVRVITVPKTLKTPRIIAIEPCCQQYTQHGIAELIMSALGKYKFSKGHIIFDDQTKHRALALESSITREYATIDLSSASDRVPNYLIGEMFASHPDIRHAIQATRSSTAKLPSGEIVRLKKFASMGSSLCFPIQAMYFYTICVIALTKARGLSMSHCYKVVSDIYVYGDDIIVPTREVAAVIETLQKYHCKVGSDKSFYRGFFRESCGMDAYAGVCVTPTYFRSATFPQSLQEGSAITSFVATARQLFRAGYWLTADLIFKKIETIVGDLPVTQENCAVLGRNSFLPAVSADGWSKIYHVPLVYGYVVKEVKVKDNLDGYYALTKCLTTPLEARAKTGITPGYLQRSQASVSNLKSKAAQQVRRQLKSLSKDGFR